MHMKGQDLLSRLRITPVDLVRAQQNDDHLFTAAGIGICME